MNLDQLGPEAANSFPGQRLVHARPSEAGEPAERARQEIDYGRRGKGSIVGAFCPATGEASTKDYRRRTIANWVNFLEEVDHWLPSEAERVFGIVDTLKVHRATDVLLFSLAHPRSRVPVPTQGRGLPESDRALVENPAVPGTQGAAL